MTSLLLASASPSRLTTLRRAGIEPLVQVSNVDEDALLDQALLADPDLSPADQVLILAQGKARDVCANLGAGLAPDLIVGADSMLEFDGQVVGKPLDSEVARQRWRAMSGRRAALHSGHWVITSDGKELGATSSTIVHFANLSDHEIDAYVRSTEPLQVAGGFTIDGLGGPFISRITGDHHGVLGLSLPLLRNLLLDLGIAWPSLWNK
ncbi:nucleoside triphosphate pyrophosphatase [Jonesiaceae bacterium BS-20]|uniref:Nucleoside triphosphate pyrophosphatase n=1 Tax=Jonesiaceae bacterium BS-20 TaxID=3120821 RepID=A0AAU7DYF3_9MICO